MKVPSQVRVRIFDAMKEAGGVAAVLERTRRVRADGQERPACSESMINKFKYGLAALGPGTVAELREVLTDVEPEVWLAAMGAAPTEQAEATP